MKLIVGPANSGKSERVLSRAAETLAQSKGRVLLIVPSANAQDEMLARLQSQFLKQRIAPSRPMQAIRTFPELYTELLVMAGCNLSVIDGLERDRLLRRVIKNLVEEELLDYFAQTASSHGLANSLAGLVAELWRSGTDQETFTRIVDERNPKDRDISLIFARYAKTLEQSHLIDAEGAGLMAVRALESVLADSAWAPIRKRFSLIAADGFDFYTPAQVKLLSLLSSLDVEVAATLTWQKGRSVHLWQQPTIDRFHRSGAEILEMTATPKGQIERAASLLMRDDTDDLSGETTESVLSSLSHQNEDTTESSITVISAPDRATEARTVAREIKRLILEREFGPEDITIVCRSHSLYSNHLERVFIESDMPLTIDGALALGDNPLVYALLKLLVLAANDFPRRAVLDILRSPYFDISSFGLDSRSVSLIDYASRQKNVLRNSEDWLKAIREADYSRDESGIEEVSEEEWRERREQTAESLMSFFDAVSLEQEASIQSYIKNVRELTGRLSVEERARQSQWHERDNVALDAFLSALDRLHPEAMSDPGDRTDIKGFLLELERAVASMTLERTKSRSASVVVQEIHHLRPRRFRAVFALGLIEGEFPARITETSPYTLIERDELRRKGIDMAETTSDPGADLLQFYKVMSSAIEKLYLSYARADLAGSELLRSYLVDEVKAVSQCREIRIAQSLAEIDRSRIISREELALITARNLRDAIIEDGAEALANIQTNDAVNLLKSEHQSWNATIRGAMVEYGRIRQSGRGNFSGFIGDPQLLAQLKERLGPEYEWNASQINDYGVCPFRFFAKYLLDLQSSEEPVEGFAADKLGTAYHDVLERVYRRIDKEEIQITIDDESKCVALVGEVVEICLEEMSEKGKIRKGAFWEFDKREIKRHVIRLLLAESEWRREVPAKPMNFEMRFGERGEPPLIVECEDGNVKLRGKIDRIDKREDGLVVIDYKLGRTPLRHQDALDGRNIQLPIYAMAAENLMRGTMVASAYYLHITSRKRGSEMPKGNDETLSVSRMIEHAKRYIRDYVSRARRGHFPVSPNGDRCQPRCEYRVMCRIQSLGSYADDRDTERANDEG